MLRDITIGQHFPVKMILAAKARRDAGETLVLPRDEDQKGGAAEC